MDILDDVDRAISDARLLRHSGGYTVMNKNQPHRLDRGEGVAYLSRRDVEFEERTGEASTIRKNLEKLGYEVYPYWEQVL